MNFEIGIDANDVELLALFWMVALDCDRGSGDGDPYLNLTPRNGGPPIFLQKVPEPKTAKTRVHFDLYPDRPEELIERLVAAGGRRLGSAVMNGNIWCQVMADPEGNELCVCATT